MGYGRRRRSRARRMEVVAAVIIRDGRILCAQRGPGGAIANLWEFPGGKVEPGETHEQALIREIDEELTCTVRVFENLETTRVPYRAGRQLTLHTYRCELVRGEPALTEHAALTWALPHELSSLDWAPADLPTVEKLRSLRAGDDAR